MDVIAQALRKPKVIDLDTYGGGTFETSVTAVILGLLNSNGGTQQNVPMGNLFSDLNTKRPIRVQLSFPFSSTEILKVTVDGVSTVRNGDQVESLYANVLFAGMGAGIISLLVHININGIITLSMIAPNM